jgi:hypothetical protein
LTEQTEQDEGFRYPTEGEVRNYIELMDRFRKETGSIPGPLVRPGMVAISSDLKMSMVFFSVLLDEYPDLLAYFERDEDADDEADEPGEGPMAIDHAHGKPPAAGKVIGGIPEHARGYQ